jgi:hypothetical protein
MEAKDVRSLGLGDQQAEIRSLNESQGTESSEGRAAHIVISQRHSPSVFHLKEGI